MKWISSLHCLVLVVSTSIAQEPVKGILPSAQPDTTVDENVAGLPCDVCAPIFASVAPAPAQSGFLNGNRNFPGFISFLSNPLQSIDPRPMTAIWPIFISSWVSNSGPIPDGDIQVYGAGLYLALTDRLSMGLNQGGYATAHFDRDRMRFLGQDRSGDRDGWLNLGGFFQYLLIEDVPNQFLLTVGMRWEAPSGSSTVFQGRGPAYLAPYLTAGKEIGNFHILATAGYEFPAGSGNVTSEYFYTNVHLDRQMFGWFYPLVELNWTYHTSSAEFGLPTRKGFIDLGNFSSSGNTLALAVGANAVLIPEKLELGAVYTTSLATQRNFEFDGLLVKMIIRY